TPLDLAQAMEGLHVQIAERRRVTRGPVLRLPRTALYAGQGVNERPRPYLASVRHALDRLGFPYSMLEETDVCPRLAGLAALGVPGGNARDIVEGWPATGLGRAAPWQSAGTARGIGTRGLSAIRAFVRRGGTYVGIGAGGGLLAGPAFLQLIDFEVVAATL